MTSTTSLVVAAIIVLTMRSVADAAPSGPGGPNQSSLVKSPETVETVAVSGCLKAGPGETWELVDASDPVPSTANSPSAKELAELRKSGPNRFQLIGVSIFGLPRHRNHVVAVKGLLVKAAPINRINLTSVTMLSETCPAR